MLLNARLLNEIVRKLPDGEVTLSVSASNRATISAAGSKTTLQGMSAQDFPQLPAVPEDDPIELPQVLLRDMIRETGFAVAADDARPILMGIYLEVEDDVLTLVALDGFPPGPPPRQAARKRRQGLGRGLRALLHRGGRGVPGRRRRAGDPGALQDAPSAAGQGLYGHHPAYWRASTSSTASSCRPATPSPRGSPAASLRTASTARPSWRARARTTCCASRSARTSSPSPPTRRWATSTRRWTSKPRAATSTSPSTCATSRTQSSPSTRSSSTETKLNSNISPCVLVPTEGEDFLYLVLPVRTAG